MPAWNTDEIDVAETLIRMKEVLGLSTDRQLAEMLGVSNKTISSWQTRNLMPPEAVVYVGRQTDVSLDRLFCGLRGMTERILVTLTVDADGVHRLNACLEDGSFARILVNGSPFDAAAAEMAARAAASDDLIF